MRILGVQSGLSRSGEECRAHRRHGEDDGHALAFDQLERRPGLEAGNEREAGSRRDGGVHAAAHAEDVRERRRAEHDIVLAQAEADVCEVVDAQAKPRLGQLDPFWIAGRARRVEDHRDVVAVGDRRCVDRWAVEVVDLEECCAGVVDPHRHLAFAEQRVEWDRRCPEAEHAVVGGHRFGPVRQDERDPVSGSDAAFAQSACGARSERIQLPIRQSAIVVREGGTLRETQGRLREQSGERQPIPPLESCAVLVA